MKNYIAVKVPLAKTFNYLYNKSLLDQRLFGSPDGRDITALYMDRGYLFFQIIPVEINVTNDNKINYQVRIIEGKEARVKNVTIKGNTKTSDHVILREIRTKPGDLFSKGDIMRTQRELKERPGSTPALRCPRRASAPNTNSPRLAFLYLLLASTIMCVNQRMHAAS